MPVIKFGMCHPNNQGHFSDVFVMKPGESCRQSQSPNAEKATPFMTGLSLEAELLAGFTHPS
jgi:hypothetical protein